MNRRTLLVGGTAAVAVAAFGGAAWFVRQKPQSPASAAGDAAGLPATPGAALDPAVLNRPHSPVLGPVDAPVTITEFFDPSCEACRAFHPIVQKIRDEFPTQVRVVLRYAAFHEGSDEAVRILETARVQKVFEPVLVALLEGQPEWAPHTGPNLDVAWEIAGRAGLDVTKAKVDRMLPGIVYTLKTDAEDVAAVGVQQTPTFFINAKPLADFGPESLVAAVRQAVAAL